MSEKSYHLVTTESQGAFIRFMQGVEAMPDGTGCHIDVAVDDYPAITQQNQELRALLKEAECPHAEDDYKSVRRNGGWYCYAGKKIKKTGHYALEDGNCPFCARRDALLGEGNDG